MMTEAKQLRLYGLTTVPLLAMLSTTPIFLTAGNQSSALPLIWVFACLVIGFVWQFNIVLYRLLFGISSYGFYIVSFVSIISLVLGIRYFGFSYLQMWIQNNNLGLHPPPAIVSVFLGLINNVFTLLVQYLIRLQHRHVAAEKEITDLKYAQITAEFNNLKTHIQPHFLFNALNTLKVLIKKNPVEAEIYVLKISDFLRASLLVNDKKVNTLADELKMAETYLDIQSMRFKNCIILEKNMDLSAAASFVLPVLTLQTLFENAIKHNILSVENPLFISVDMDIEAKTMTVSNTYMPKITKEHPSSQTGLRNLNDRFEWLGGIPLSIEIKNGFFIVKIQCLEAYAFTHN